MNDSTALAYSQEMTFIAEVYTTEQPGWVAQLIDAPQAVLEPVYGRSRPGVLNDGVGLREDAPCSGLGRMWWGPLIGHVHSWHRKRARDASGSAEVAVPGDSAAETVVQRRRDAGRQIWLGDYRQKMFS